MLVRGAEPMEKRPAGVAFSPLSLAFVMLTVTLSAYLPSARRRLMTERSERMSEVAENHQNVQ